jgi:membrane associated rhomboid family serine protease
MIPLRDTLRSHNYPIVNNSIIAINVMVYIFEMTQGHDLDRFLYIYGLVPARYSIAHVAAYFTTGQQLFALFSFMFLHGGFWHLLGNMWSLYIFGDNIEDRLGPLRYLLFYLLCGLTSGLAHLIFNLGSNVPTIGASGAIAGVMGAYFILYPRSKILTQVRQKMMYSPVDWGVV